MVNMAMSTRVITSFNPSFGFRPIQTTQKTDDWWVEQGFNPSFGFRPIQTHHAILGQSLPPLCFNPSFGFRPIQTGR